MAFLLLLDYLTGQMALVNAPTTAVVPPTPHYFIPVFFNLIPQ